METGIFGNETATKVLLYLQNYAAGYASAIASDYGLPVSVVQKQLVRLEREGVLVSTLQGRTRVFQWNPRMPYRAELSALLEKILLLNPPAALSPGRQRRRRPRRTGKPL